MGVLERLALWAQRHYRPVFLLFVLLVALSLERLTHLRFDTDVLKLLPQDDPMVRTFLDTLEDFGTIDYLLIVVRIPEGQVVAPYETFADELAARLQTLPEIGRLEYRIGEMEELLVRFFPKAVLFLDEEGRGELQARLTDQAIRRRVQEIRHLLGTPQGMVLKDLFTLDPLGLSQVFLERLEGSRGDLRIDWTTGYYLSRDHTLLLLLAEPVRPPQDVDFGRRLVAAVERAVAEVQGEWPRIVGFGGLGEEGPPPPEVVLGGSYLTALDDARFIREDMTKNVLTSMIGVLGLFLLAFRRLGPLAYAVVPLACGLLFTFAFASLTLGGVSVATSGTAALLIGLGIDFVIVSYGRYVEERRRGVDLGTAVARMARSSGPAVVVGAVTTAATFYAFTFTAITGSEFRGLLEMGLLTGTGILFCMVSVLLLLPAMFAWHERHHERRETRPGFYLHAFGAARLTRFAMAWPRGVLLAGLVVTLAAGVLAPRLEFQETWEQMRPQGNRGIEVAEEVARKFGSGFNYMMLVISGETAGAVLQRTDRVTAAARRLVEEGVISRVDSVAGLIPSPQRQQEVLRWLVRERAKALNPERIVATFREALAAEGMRYAPFEPGIDLLARAVTPAGPLELEDLAGSQETRRLLERYVQETDRGWTGVVYLYPSGNQWRREPPPQVVALAEELGPEVVLTGSNVINQRMRWLVKRDAWIAGILGFILVGILIYLDFGRFWDTVAALTPLLVGILWMLGAMAVLDLKLNFMNIFVTTMIIGIGVDYGLHILHRYREMEGRSPEEFQRGLLETSKAVFIAALSTICGFGSLSTSHYPGLSSTGYVATLGALATSLVAITLLPAWLTLRRRRRGLEPPSLPPPGSPPPGPPEPPPGGSVRPG